MKTKFKSEGVKKIELYGTIGEFNVPKSVYKLKYFNTIANNRLDGSPYNELLEKLSPMREKTNASEIKDIKSLLQRDLNDHRIKKKLIPYLLNSNDVKRHIAFFPSILCVMMPNGFITDRNASYPDVIEKDPTDDSKKYSYEEFWEYDQYLSDYNKSIPVAKLTIFTSKTEMVVIDGQHRANAFRVVTKNFDGNGANHLYNRFYKDIKLPDVFEADLPVTILWFESSDKNNCPVEPEKVSRELFLDVNNTPDPVSISRQILMDDSSPSRAITQYFYTYLSSRDFNDNAFEEGEFSLFHSGFDFDQNIKSKNKPSVFTITVPEIINHAMDWILFGKLEYNNLDKKIAPAERKELSIFSDYINIQDTVANYIELIEDADEKFIKSLKPDAIDDTFKDLIKSDFLIHIYKLFNDMNFLKPHFKACKILGDYAKDEIGDFGSGVWQECWKKIFKGGEGLYYVFRNAGKIENYVTAIEKIEGLFKEERSKLFNEFKLKEIEKAHTTFLSVAFQVGYLKAFDLFHRKTNPYEIAKSVENFMDRINEFSADDWVYILTEMKQNYETKSLSPTKWPAFQNLIIRMIQKKDEFFDSTMYFKDSPDYYMIENDFKTRCTANAKTDHNLDLKLMNFSDFDSHFLDRSIKDSVDEISKKFQKLNLKILKYPIKDRLKHSLKGWCKK